MEERICGTDAFLDWTIVEGVIDGNSEDEDCEVIPVTPHPVS